MWKGNRKRRSPVWNRFDWREAMVTVEWSLDVSRNWSGKHGGFDEVMA
jgi:hypothetical protein